MKIKSMHLADFCGYDDFSINFRDFSCLVGPNGIGKTTILNAVSLLCSSLDFKTEEAGPGGWKPTVSAQDRLRAFLRKNIRNIDDESPSKGFRIEAIFEHEGQDLHVVLNQAGFEKNEVITQPFWWAGVCYFAKFDVNMVDFQLRKELWPRFKKAYEGITGIEIEPEIHIETDLAEGKEIVTGFFLHKRQGNKDSRTHSRHGSAGEKKIAKALSQVVNLEDQRQPHIILCDNLEMHTHYTRHLRMVEEMKDLFAGKQLIATTHSMPIIQSYQPKEDLFDIELMKTGEIIA